MDGPNNVSWYWMLYFGLFSTNVFVFVFVYVVPTPTIFSRLLQWLKHRVGLLMSFGLTSPTETIETVKLSRRQRKAALTCFLGDLQHHCTESEGEAVKQKLDRLRSAFVEFQKSHDAYYDILMQDNNSAESDIDASDDWYSKVVANYYDGIAAANTWLNKADNDDVTGPCKDSGYAHWTYWHSFYIWDRTWCFSDPLEFQSFMAVFDETVKCKKIDDQDKLTRLLQ